MREIVLPLALLCAAACGETTSPASSGGTAPSASAATSGKSETRSAVGLKITVPSSWRDAGPQTTMNPSVKLVLPKADGDEDGMVRIFRGAMGPKDANIQRWISQMAQAEGKNSADVAKIRDLKSGPLSITFLDVSGAFTDTAMGGPPSPTQPNYRLLAAYIDGPGQTWYVKGTGPEKTMARWHDDFERMLSTLAPE